MKKVTSRIKLSWSVHDSWTELLSGTRFLLDILKEKERDEIAKINLLRLVLVSSSQMVEVMLFTQLKLSVKPLSVHTKKLLEYDLNNRITYSEACSKWPEILTGNKFVSGIEPMQSMKTLSKHRNLAIHHTATCPLTDVGESAFYTAIEVSKYIYNHFNRGNWENSEYKKFVKNNKPNTQILLRTALGE